VKALSRYRDRAFTRTSLVLEDGRVVGLVSPSDIARRLELADLRDLREVAHL